MGVTNSGPRPSGSILVHTKCNVKWGSQNVNIIRTLRSAKVVWVPPKKKSQDLRQIIIIVDT